MKLRRISFLILVSQFILITVIPAETTAQNEPLGLYLTWQQDPTTTMTIDWHVIGTPEETILEYRKKNDGQWQTKSGDYHEFPYSKRFINRVELTDLEPDTKYEFRFGEEYKVYTFRTMPEKLTRPLRIAIGGDTMHHQDLFEKTNRQVLPYDPDFIVIGGDLAYADGLPPEEQGIRADPVTMLRTEHPRPGVEEGDNLWYHWFNAYKNTLITDEGRVIPMLVTIGNHEESQGKAPYFFALFAMPGEPGYNVLDFGDYLSFVLLDSGHVNPIEGEQTDWLKKVLTERKDVPHLFPVYHVPAWPSARDFNDPRTKPVRDNWVSIFEEHNIRIAFENHDHTYKRTFPLRDGKIKSNGVVYVGDGSWGTVPRAIGAGTEDRNRPYWEGLVSYDSSNEKSTDELREFSEEYWYLTIAESAMHFILLTIDGIHQHLLTIDDEGNVIDEYPSTPFGLAAQTTNNEILLPDPGVVSFTFRHQFEEDVPGTLDMIKEMGFTNIEFSNLFGKSPAEMKRLLDERGLICTSYGVSYDRLVNETSAVAQEANTLGASYVRVAWIPHESPFDIDDTRRAIEDFERAGKILSDHGLKFNYHNHGYEFRPYNDGTLFDYMVQNSNPDYVNFEMDTFWVAHPGHDPVELLKTYPDRFNLVHLKDLKKGVEHDYSGGAPAEYDVPLGTGQIDFEGFLKAAQNSSIEYFYIEDETDDVITRVPQSREYIMSITK